MLEMPPLYILYLFLVYASIKCLESLIKKWEAPRGNTLSC